jgi:hypothetical protein
VNETQPLILPSNVVARPVQLDAPRTYHLPRWGSMPDPQRLAFLRSVAVQRGRDPRIRQIAFRLVAGIPERDYPRQAAAILKAVQPGGPLMAYVNEPGEVLQDPLYTLKVKAGDCDDAAILLASLFEAVRLPWRFVLSGRALTVTDAPTRPTGPRMRWVEGTPYPSGRVKWGHIYVVVGWPVFNPRQWAWAEPTIRNAPLGWDVTSHVARTGQSALPELGAVQNPPVPVTAPAPAVTAGSAAAGATQRSLVETVLVSVTTMVLATIAIETLRAKGVIPGGAK